MNLKRALAVMCDAEVEFVVVGGVAATIHGSAHATYDLDVCYSRTKGNLTRLKSALEPYRPRPRGFPKELPFIWDEATLRNNSVLTLQSDLGNIDLLAEIAGLGTYEQVKAHSQIVDMLDRQIAVLNLPGLIRAKRAAGREKDLSIIPELESLLEADEEA
jgi:hypothetical protein